MQKEMEEINANDFLYNLQKAKKKKRIILSAVIRFIIITFLIVLINYNNSSKKELQLGAEIESVFIGEAGENVYVQLLA
jgi:hypothetical protein